MSVWLILIACMQLLYDFNLESYNFSDARLDRSDANITPLGGLLQLLKLEVIQVY